MTTELLTKSERDLYMKMMMTKRFNGLIIVPERLLEQARRVVDKTGISDDLYWQSST